MEPTNLIKTFRRQLLQQKFDIQHKKNSLLIARMLPKTSTDRQVIQALQHLKQRDLKAFNFARKYVPYLTNGNYSYLKDNFYLE